MLHIYFCFLHTYHPVDKTQLIFCSMNNNQLPISLAALTPPVVHVPDPPGYVGWRHYPVGAAHSNLLISPTAAYNEQLHRLSPKLFSDEIKLRIIDIEKRRGMWEPGKWWLPRFLICYRTTDQVHLHTIWNDGRRWGRTKAKAWRPSENQNNVTSTPYLQTPRILPPQLTRPRLLHSANTALPLRLNERLMRKILTRYQVDPGFLPVLFSFGEEPHIAESGSNNITHRKDINGSRSMLMKPL